MTVSSHSSYPANVLKPRYLQLNLVSVALAAAAMLAMPATAHHSFANFDMAQTKTISGTVRALEWSNPHVWLWVDVAGYNGTQLHYGFEGAAPGEMDRRGWNKRVVVRGDKVTVSFAPLRSGQTGGSMKSVVTAAGTLIGGQFSSPPGAPGGPPAVDGKSPAGP